MDGTLNLNGSVNERDEELSNGSRQRRDFQIRQEQILNKHRVNTEEASE